MAWIHQITPHTPDYETRISLNRVDWLTYKYKVFVDFLKIYTNVMN